jgi:hypothetical protein
LVPIRIIATGTSEAVERRADSPAANWASAGSAARRNAFCYGKINDVVKYLNGSGAITTAARRK